MARLGFLSSSLVRLSCLVVLFSPSLTLANAGQLLFARGEVSILGTDGQSRAGRVGAAVDEGDHITTGDNSMVQIRLSDGALVSLRSHSDYQIQVQKEKGLLEQAGKLFSGWMRSVSGAIGQSEPDKVSWSTPVATIGIRGTTFQVIHVPEGGLPGYDDTPPGTYIFLEEGGIESSTEGGTRYIQPGQVVWVPDGKQRPRLAPERRGLFLAGLGSDLDSQDRRRVRRALARRQESEDDRDRISDALLSGFLDQGTPAALAIYQSSMFPNRLRSIDPNVKTVGLGTSTVVTGMRMPGDPVNERPEYRIYANQGATPVSGSPGGIRLSSGSVITWGAWANGDYTVEADFGSGLQPDTNLSGPWHYAWTDGPLFDVPDVVELGLTGRFDYGYAGGTLLSGPGGDFRVTRGGMTVDFGSRDIFTFLGVENTLQPGEIGFSGSGSFADFYYFGLGLTGNDGGSGYGSIQGIFAGDRAEGVVSTVELSPFGGSTDLISGVAAFRRTGLEDYRRVAGVGSWGSPPSVIASGNLQYLNFGAERVLIGQQEFGPGPESVTLGVQDETALSDTGWLALEGGTEVNWGVWAGGSYTADVTTSDGITEPTAMPAADWHYMMANNAIFDEAELLSLGLPQGTYSYFYSGGTAFTSANGTGNYSISAGQIDLLLGSAADMSVVDLSVFDGVNTLSLDSGTTPVSVTDFYNNGITLLDAGGTPTGSIDGAFVGRQAEGIISTVNYNDGTGDYTATAAFQR